MDDPAAPRSGKRSLSARLRAYFLAGVLVTAPLAITAYLAVSFLLWIDTGVGRLVPARYNPDTYLPFSVPGIGLLLVIVFLTLAGWSARNLFGRFLLRASEALLERMPVVRGIYATLKQVFHTAMAGGSHAFREVVLLEFPRPGLWAMGFVTGSCRGEVQARLPSAALSVFVPTAPNPTSGFLLFVPRRDLVFLEMTVEEAIKMVVSAGMITPPTGPGKAPNPVSAP
ncbi:MAG: DUF502 domain-containing protein [Desulfobacterales bacterium]